MKEYYNQGFENGVLAIINEMKLRQLLDGEFYVLSKEKLNYLKQLYLIKCSCKIDKDSRGKKHG